GQRAGGSATRRGRLRRVGRRAGWLSLRPRCERQHRDRGARAHAGGHGRRHRRRPRRVARGRRGRGTDGRAPAAFAGPAGGSAHPAHTVRQVSDPPRVDTVVFDLGGVLIDWNPEHLYRRLIPDPDVRAHFLSTVATLRWNDLQDRGRSLREGTAALLEEHPEHAELIRAYYGQWQQMIAGEIPGTVAIVTELRRRGTKLFALTNWSAETFPIAFARFEFLGLLAGIVVSGQEGLAKP